MSASVKKSSPKSRNAGAFVKGDPRIRRGRGPKKGAANAGRTPDEIRKVCRQSFDKRVPLLEAFADNPLLDEGVRMKAMEMLGKYGLGTTWTPTNADGADLKLPQVVIL